MFSGDALVSGAPRRTVVVGTSNDG